MFLTSQASNTKSSCLQYLFYNIESLNCKFIENEDYFNCLENFNITKWSEVAQLCPTLCDPWTVAHQTPLSTGENEDYFNCLEDFNITKAFLFSFFCSPFSFLFKVFNVLLEWNLLSFIGLWGFLVGSDGKESACNGGDPGSIPGLGRSSGEGNGYPFQYSCLENSTGRVAWWAIVLGVTKSWAWLSN